jgi:hypothetical protein
MFMLRRRLLEMPIEADRCGFSEEHLRFEGPLAEGNKQACRQMIKFTGHLLNENTRRGGKTVFKITMPRSNRFGRRIN